MKDGMRRRHGAGMGWLSLAMWATVAFVLVRGIAPASAQEVVVMSADRFNVQVRVTPCPEVQGVVAHGAKLAGMRSAGRPVQGGGHCDFTFRGHVQPEKADSIVFTGPRRSARKTPASMSLAVPPLQRSALGRFVAESVQAAADASAAVEAAEKAQPLERWQEAEARREAKKARAAELAERRAERDRAARARHERAEKRAAADSVEYAKMEAAWQARREARDRAHRAAQAEERRVASVCNQLELELRKPLFGSTQVWLKHTSGWEAQLSAEDAGGMNGLVFMLQKPTDGGRWAVPVVFFERGAWCDKLVGVYEGGNR